MDPVVTDARLSASVILVRDATDGGGPELFMVRRHERSHLGPVLVFPGGTVREDDGDGPWMDRSVELGKTMSARSGEQVSGEMAGSLYGCALRELFEEAGVLLVSGLSRPVPEPELRQVRQALQREELGLRQALATWGATPGSASAVPFSHWVTPERVRSRFDAWFFMAAMPEDQEALHCDVETTEGTWLTAQGVLDACERGEAGIVFPTRLHLERLAGVGATNADELLAFARTKSIRRVQPMLRGEGSAIEPWLPAELHDAW